jgi:WD40 repeat protein
LILKIGSLESELVKAIECPDSDVLQQFLGEQLTTPDSDGIREHIRVCSQCQGLLDRLSDDSSLRMWLPDASPINLSAAPGLERLRQAMQTASFVPRNEETVNTIAPASLPAISGYDILGILGRGGMGVVYRARHQPLKRDVAIKIILAGGHAGVAQRSRFKSEAEAIARLQHPNIVQIYEVGEADGHPFCALEFVAGGSLADKLLGTPLPPLAAASLVRTLAAAIGTAHDQGIVHRDLKPANVLLTSDGAPKITDFGLAKDLGIDSGQTESGSILGTPSYMAPEQALGHIRAIGPETDVYALGAILYECLTGRPPFRGATILETLEQVRTQEPVSPSQLQSKLPRDVETICLKCLQKDPAKRYRTAAELADELQRFERGETILARPVGSVERLVRWCRRNPLVSMSIGATASALLIGAAVAIYFAVVASHARDRADQVADEAILLAQKATEEGERANREADSAWSSQYAAHTNLMASDWEIANLARVRDTMNLYRNLPPGRKDLRGWEWHYQDRLCDQALRTINDLSGGTMAFSPDGSLLATSRDEKVILWDTRTCKVKRPLPGHGWWIWGFAFSPDGKQIVSSIANNDLKLWDIESGAEVRTFHGHSAAITGIAFSQDGSRIASAATDRDLAVWDAHTGKLLHPLQPGFCFPCGVKFSSDGEHLIAGLPSGRLSKWDVRTGRFLFGFEGHSDSVVSVAVSPDGKTLASTSLDRTVRLWDLQTGAQLRIFKRSTDFDSRPATPTARSSCGMSAANSRPAYYAAIPRRSIVWRSARIARGWYRRVWMGHSGFGMLPAQETSAESRDKKWSATRSPSIRMGHDWRRRMRMAQQQFEIGSPVKSC